MHNSIIMRKYIAKFIGISKIVYAYNLDQAFQESLIFGDRRKLKLSSIIDCEEEVLKPPYFGIYNIIDYSL